MKKEMILMNNELLKKAENLTAKAEVAAVTSIDGDGYPRTAVLSNLKPEGIKTLWFSTGTISHKTENYKRDPKASICFSTDADNVTLIGNMVVVDDMNVKKELWQDWFIKHFPLGVDDPNYCILKFETKYIQAYIDDEFEDMRF
jgi:general stress protein 26